MTNTPHNEVEENWEDITEIPEEFFSHPPRNADELIKHILYLEMTEGYIPVDTITKIANEYTAYISQQAEQRETEKIKKEIENKRVQEEEYDTKENTWHKMGYNQALDDVLQTLIQK